MQTLLDTMHDYRYDILKHMIKEKDFKMKMKAPSEAKTEFEQKRNNIETLFEKLNSRFQKAEEKMNAKFDAIETRQNEMFT